MKKFILQLLRLYNKKKVVDDLVQMHEELLLIDLKNSEVCPPSIDLDLI